MRPILLSALLAGACLPAAQAQTVDELVAKNIQARGGIEALRAIQSLKASGRMNFSGGDFSVDLGIVSYNERDARLRMEASIQGLTQVTAYDGREAWTINPFQGRRDPERMSAEDAKSLQVQADIDGPLVDWKAKGHRVEYLGTEDVDGTEAHKLKVSLANGDVQYRYLDPDYFLEILVVSQSMRRGVETETETELGNYEKVAGVYLPFAQESGPKGGRRGQKILLEKVEANVEIDDALFAFPVAAK
ncbi:MAG: hypothetical protein DYH17_03255 [Xanthomonadales bacterium PRO6]|nr:hypothetical protein [Xanthomonadales bacterium]MCE7930373.1 hypothetical protein [Xanthomonadales bacterium PRO6]